MDITIYEQLINHPHNELLIKSILALSINDIYISPKSLIDYCNDHIEDKEKQYINNKQFQILNHFVKYDLLNYKVDNNKSIHTYPINNNSNNKLFQNSISLIIENNKNHSNKIEIKDKNYFLFKKVWNNKVIRNEITFHLRLYNIHINTVIIKSNTSLNNYKFKNYLNSIIYSVDNKSSDYDFKDDKEELEKKSGDGFEETDKSIIKFPNGLTNIIIDTNTLNLKENPLPDSITSVILSDQFNQSLKGNWLPVNLKHIEFGSSFQHIIKPYQLPPSIESIIFHQDYNCEINPLVISPKILENGLKILKQLNHSKNHLSYYKFFSSKNFRELDHYRIPNSIDTLEFESDFNQDIKIGDLPPTVTSIKFGDYFNSSIEPNSLPILLKQLKFGFKFNQCIVEKQLPVGLTTIYFGDCFNQTLSSKHLPPSLTYIKFGKNYNKELNLKNCNLKSIKFSKLSRPSQFNNQSFPESLTSLSISKYQHDLKSNYFPPSLLFFSLNSNRDLLVNELPNSITSLTIKGYYNKQIHENALPSTLKILHIKSNSRIDLSSYSCLPNSIESIYIHDAAPKLTYKPSLKNIYCNNLRILNSFKIATFMSYCKTFKTNKDNKKN